MDATLNPTDLPTPGLPFPEHALYRSNRVDVFT